MNGRETMSAVGDQTSPTQERVVERAPWRPWAVTGGVTAGVLALAVGGSLATGTNPSALTGGVERLAATSNVFLGGITDILPLGYAFGAGMAAAVNPCGFAMLPAYLGLYLGTGEAGSASGHPDQRMGQAYLVSLLVTAGFVLLFGTVGLLISAGARVLISLFPWIALVIGVLLVGAGAWVLAGGGLYTQLGSRLAVQVGDVRQPGVRSYFLFGITYATASLSCTLPIFLAVVGSSMARETFLGAVSQFVLYALGMGTVILILTISITLFEGAILGVLRRALPYMRPAGAVLMILAGAFIVYYWLTLGGLLAAFR